jgi:hypothetical protein
MNPPNPRNPMVTLTTIESERVRLLIDEKGPKETMRALGIYDRRTLSKVVWREPVRRDTATVIRMSLERI